MEDYISANEFAELIFKSPLTVVKKCKLGIYNDIEGFIGAKKIKSSGSNKIWVLPIHYKKHLECLEKRSVTNYWFHLKMYNISNKANGNT